MEEGLSRCTAPRTSTGIRIALSVGMASIRRRTRLHFVVAMASLTFSVALSAETRIDPDRNRFSPAQDVELGRRAAAELRQELPIVRDRQTENYVGRIGERLTAAIPDRLQQ